MKLKGLNRSPFVGTHVASFAMPILWQTFFFVVRAAVVSNDCDEEASLPPPLLRSAGNITTANDLNQCNTECVSSIEETSGCLGFAGDDCSFPFVVCPDSVTQCFGPYSTCVDQSETPSTRDFKCECQASSSMAEEPISIMMQESRLQDCRDRITEVCVKNQTVSSYSFCTNGGECVDKIKEGEVHPGCFCPGRFVGQHCEKRRGTGRDYRFEEPERVNDRPPTSNQAVIENRRIGMSTGLVLALLTSALSAFLIYAAVLYKRFLSTNNNHPIEEENGQDENHDMAEAKIHVLNGIDTASPPEMN